MPLFVRYVNDMMPRQCEIGFEGLLRLHDLSPDYELGPMANLHHTFTRVPPGTERLLRCTLRPRPLCPCRSCREHVNDTTDCGVMHRSNLSSQTQLSSAPPQAATSTRTHSWQKCTILKTEVQNGTLRPNNLSLMQNCKNL